MLLPESLLTGENAAFVEQIYLKWLHDPASVDPEFAAAFSDAGFDRRTTDFVKPEPVRSSIFAAGSARGRGADLLAAAERQAKVVQLINAWRVRGHMKASIDPLNRRPERPHPELTLEYYGLSSDDLDKSVPTRPLRGMPPVAPLRDILTRLRMVYAAGIGSEFMNIDDQEQKLWVQRRLEGLPDRPVLNRQAELRFLRKLSDAENFERMLHTRFPGTKRFGLEGGETLIPLLDMLKSEAASLGIKEIVLGMAHRGRLNVLANVLEKPAGIIIREFEGVHGATQGSGDVKYHLGYSSNTVTSGGESLHLSLTPNPSHLEAVDPVVQGRVRAKQDRVGDVARELAMPVLIHGDTAFSGQGIVSETFQLSELAGYRTGGTVHVIVNNQIGFTTPPLESRSTPYCTDIARMMAIPIFHVNGEDPSAVAAVVQMAVAWRQKFKRDVVIDMYCYRLHGHNEGDEPSFTQPLMYDAIRSRPSPREVYEAHLLALGHVNATDIHRIHQDSKKALEAQVEGASRGDAILAPAIAEKSEDPDLDFYLSDDNSAVNPVSRPKTEATAKDLWARYLHGDIRDESDTRFDPEALVDLLRTANTIPDGFTAHSKVKRLVKQRMAVVTGARTFDWSMAEQAAFATLVAERYRVRLSGQDSGRGTFSQRHAVWTDIATGDEFYSLQHLHPDQGEFNAIDSSLSELAVLGFEVGYSMDTPDGLILWEAQFGDFANGAQIIIDQFVAASEQKWHRMSGITLLLPHGFEGQGPEHSSARLERFLVMCAQANMQVAYPSTPASYYHLLRRQALRFVRKPLVIMTPKSLLRHPECRSKLSEIADGRFQPVIDEIDGIDADRVRRVVLCSGKVYYDLVTQRRKTGIEDVALVRIELLYPYPQSLIDQVLGGYPDDAEIVWCQEEPRNMGAWPVLAHWMWEHLSQRFPRYVGRTPAASPATGVHSRHVEEQKALVSEALTLESP